MEQQNKQHDVFLSYAGEDSVLAGKLKSQIEKEFLMSRKRKIDIYSYKHDYEPQEVLKAMIEDALSNSECVVMILTKPYLEKIYTKEEARLVDKKGKKYITFWCDVSEEDVRRTLPWLADKRGFELSENNIDQAVRRTLSMLNYDVKVFDRDTRVLISTESAFNHELYKALCEANEVDKEIEIINLYELASSCNGHDIAFRKALQGFLSDDTATLLYAVLTEDQNLRFRENEIIENIKKLHSSGRKKVIFFESGKSWLEKEISMKNGDTSVFVIKTAHDLAVDKLIQFVEKKFINVYNKIHFITILGPGDNPAALERKKIYNKFLSWLVRNRCIVDQSSTDVGLVNQNRVLSRLNDDIETLQITTLRIQTWDRADAETIAERYFSKHTLPEKKERDSFHYCFLCGNDEIALGVYDAIRRKAGDDIGSLNMSFIGYDGIEEMQEKMNRREIDGATIKVDFADMINHLRDIRYSIKNNKCSEQNNERSVFGSIIFSPDK
jgi:hypothetical protein